VGDYLKKHITKKKIPPPPVIPQAPPAPDSSGARALSWLPFSSQIGVVVFYCFLFQAFEILGGTVVLSVRKGRRNNLI